MGQFPKFCHPKHAISLTFYMVVYLNDESQTPVFLQLVYVYNPQFLHKIST